MSRLFAALTLWLLLLIAAQPASGMMSVPPENRTWEIFSPPAFDQGGGWLWNQDGTRDAAPCDYDFALDVRDGPNLYAYVKQNPWTSFDPEGLWAGVDDLVALGAGAIIGVAVQGASDLWHGKASGWEDYVAAGVGGAAAGEAALYTGGLASGAAGGAAANLTRQGLKNLSGKQHGFDAKGLALETGFGALGGKLGEELAPVFSRTAARALQKQGNSAGGQTAQQLSRETEQVVSAETQATKTTGEHSAILRKNLEADGRPVLADEDAAHIVASGHPRHAEAREILDRAGIGVDDAINGGGLPSNTKVPNPLGKTTHNVTHRHSKMDQVTRELRQAEHDGAVHDTLRDIESRRQSGTF